MNATHTSAFMRGYLHKEANPRVSPQAFQQNLQNNQAALGQIGEYQDQSMLGQWANAGQGNSNMTQGQRAMGEGLAAAGIGALGGYMAGGDAGSAMMGGGVAALLYYLANTFFGKDMQKARTWVDTQYRNKTLGTAVDQLKKTAPEGSAIHQVDADSINNYKRMGEIHESLKTVKDPTQIAALNTELAGLQESMGQAYNPAKDMDGDGVPDTQQAPTPAPTTNATQGTAPNAAPGSQQAGKEVPATKPAPTTSTAPASAPSTTVTDTTKPGKK